MCDWGNAVSYLNRENGYGVTGAIKGAVEDDAADMVNHPAHYQAGRGGVECIDIAESFGFNLGNVIKYVWRAGRKPGVSPVEDLRKAAWYLAREIDKVTEGECAPVSKEIAEPLAQMTDDINAALRKINDPARPGVDVWVGWKDLTPLDETQGCDIAQGVHVKSCQHEASCAHDVTCHQEGGWVSDNRCHEPTTRNDEVFMGHIGGKPHVAHSYGRVVGGTSYWCDGYV